MCLGVNLFGLILLGTLCSSWTWLSVSFPRLGKFSVMTSSNMFSAPFSYSSPSQTPIIWMLVGLILSQRCLKLSVFLKILFSFFSSACMMCSTLPVPWFVPPYHLFCWFLLVHFSFYFLDSSPLFGCSFIFSNSLLNTYDFSLCSSVFLLSSLIISWSLPWSQV